MLLHKKKIPSKIKLSIESMKHVADRPGETIWVDKVLQNNISGKIEEGTKVIVCLKDDPGCKFPACLCYAERINVSTWDLGFDVIGDLPMSVLELSSTRSSAFA